MPRTARKITTTTSSDYDPLMSPTPVAPKAAKAKADPKPVTATVTEEETVVLPTSAPQTPLDLFLNFSGSKLVTITPTIAQYILENCNTLNRPLNKKRVTQIANSIKSGEWQINGETIIFSKNKRLLDGQYRLSAIVAANRDVDTYVTTDIEDSAFETIDTGKARTGSHVLSIKHTKHAFAVAATLNKVNRFYNKNYDFDGAGVLTNRQIVRLAAQHPTVKTSVERFLKYPRGISKSTLSFCHYILNSIDPTTTETLFAQLGEENPTIPIIAVLKKHIVKGKSGKTHRLKQTAVIGSIFKTWNAMRSNTQTDDITLHVSEAFPMPQ